MPSAEVLGEDLATAAGHPVHACVAEACRRVGVAQAGAIGQEDELGDRQRVELHPLAVALPYGCEELAVVVDRELRVEAAVEADEIASDLEQVVDLREDVVA